MMQPVPLRAESAREAGNEPLFARSDGKPHGPPPKNPTGDAATGGARRIGSGKARVQSTVPPGIINPSKHDSLSRLSGQSGKSDPSFRRPWFIANKI
ncbi:MULTISPECIES: hypothetical protein [Burkholderia cepacia complex]|uniref:hypothetical protein n=1 Tax=Burkholderia cepacia complex TaxID=87882 RepID=UPI0012ED4B59|nr:MULTISPECIES: hypothetical protein [Burkholderia cepacia complex]MBR8154696.1 hypothetical protein [Burkholderia cenocepacia]MCA8082575.1 hypothetical protein [Burkholderia cenocepacia]